MPGSRETEKPLEARGGIGGESLLHPLLKHDVREVQRPLLPPKTPTTRAQNSDLHKDLLYVCWGDSFHVLAYMFYIQSQ